MNTNTIKMGTARTIDSKSYDSGSVGLYVGTWHKYNCGSLDGKWWYLCNYASLEDLLDDIAEFHNDETDPEFMVQDWDNLPYGVTASDMGECLDVRRLGMLFELAESDDRELVVDYLGTGENLFNYDDFDSLLEAAQEKCVGSLNQDSWNPFRDWAIDYFCEVNEVPENIAGYLDEEHIEREMGLDFTCGEKFVFWKH